MVGGMGLIVCTQEEGCKKKRKLEEWEFLFFCFSLPPVFVSYFHEGRRKSWVKKERKGTQGVGMGVWVVHIGKRKVNKERGIWK